MEVDYRSSVEQLYTKFAAQALLAGEVDMLAFSQFPKLAPVTGQPSKFFSSILSRMRQLWAPKLPSWVPDWASRDPVLPPYGLNAAFVPYFYAGGTTKGAEVEFKSPGTLIISGVLLDIVTASSSMPYQVPDRSAFDFHHTARHFEEILSFCTGEGRIYPDPAAVAWRIALGGLVFDGPRFNRCTAVEDSEQYAKVFKSIVTVAAGNQASPEDPAPPLDVFGRYLSRLYTMSGRKTFRTQKGYVGLGPAGLMNGDVVVVFYGGSVPYVLRREGRAFRFVGEAYCEGVMDGEALDDDLKQKFCLL